MNVMNWDVLPMLQVSESIKEPSSGEIFSLLDYPQDFRRYEGDPFSLLRIMQPAGTPLYDFKVLFFDQHSKETIVGGQQQRQGEGR